MPQAARSTGGGQKALRLAAGRRGGQPPSAVRQPAAARFGAAKPQHTTGGSLPNPLELVTNPKPAERLTSDLANSRQPHPEFFSLINV